MPLRPVCHFPDPVLSSRAEKIACLDEEVQRLIADLIDTMRKSPATIGLAAPQIGAAKRVFVSDVSPKDSSKKLRIFVNPEIISHSGKRICREGCLSLPDYTGNVVRAKRITVRGLDQKGKTVEMATSGIEAICWQHEIDHLNGLLFIHRVNNIKTDVFRRKRYSS